MSRCGRVQAEAAGLVTLAASDPARQEAFEHARTCPACAEALADAEATLAAVDVALASPAPLPQVLARAANEVRRDLRASRVRLMKGRALVVVAVAASWLLPMLGGLRLRGSGGAGLSLALALTAVGASAVVLGTGARAWLAFPLIAGTAAWSTAGPGPLAALHGLHCAAFELGVGAIPLASAALLARRGLFDRAPRALAAAGGGGAVAGQAALYVACQAVAGREHLVLFHAAPVVLAMALAAWLARSWRPAAVAP